MSRQELLRGLVVFGRGVAKQLIRPQSSFLRIRMRARSLSMTIRMKSLLQDQQFIAAVDRLRDKYSRPEVKKAELHKIDESICLHAQTTADAISEFVGIASDAARGWHVQQFENKYDWARWKGDTWWRVYTHPTETDRFAPRQYGLTEEQRRRGCRSLTLFYNKTASERSDRNVTSWDDPLRGVSVPVVVRWALETAKDMPSIAGTPVSLLADTYMHHPTWTVTKRRQSLCELLE